MKGLVVVFFALALITLPGCSSVSSEDYNSVTEKCRELELDYERVNSDYVELNDKYNNLCSDYELLKADTESWRLYSEDMKAAEQANAKAEKAEAEARLKTAEETLSALEKEEQRKITEGTVVYEDGYITVSFLGINNCAEWSNREAVTFWIENKTDISLTFFPVCVSLDGVDVGSLMNYVTISPQSKGKVYFLKNFDDLNSDFDNKTPSFVSGSLLVDDMNNTGLFGDRTQYEFSFSNIDV